MGTSLFSALQQNSLILTTNQRLATWLTQTYQKEQLNLNKAAWQEILILPIATWLTYCWQDAIQQGLLSPSYLLTDNQELILWEKIIRQSKYGDDLLQTLNTAVQAREAWRLCKHWGIDINNFTFTYAPDTQAWQIWAQEFANLCQKQAWIDHASLGILLAPIISELFLPKQINLVGFIEIPFYLEQLLNTLKKNGYHYTQWQASSLGAGARSRLIVFPSAASEIEHMAAWAYSLIKNEISDSIACIVPQLHSLRHKIIHHFTRTFASPEFFNIAGGIPLNEYPLIAIGLIILNLQSNQITFHDLNYLLHSPYLAGSATETYARAHLAIRLSQYPIPMIPLDNLLQESIACPEWQSLLRNYLTLIQEEIDLLPSQWAIIFSRQLQAFGWPGARTLDSQEYQLWQAWQAVLEEYAKLDSILLPISSSIALIHLHRIVHSTLFQAASETAPIQILSISDALGMQFDYCWIMNMDNETWPSSPMPNPFIPKSLQRLYAIPHANPERELTYCLQAFSQLQNCAQQVIFSYAQQIKERPLQPSPCLKGCQPITWDNLAISKTTPYLHQLQASHQLEKIEDDYGPSLDNVELTPGGSTIFKLQAACPLRAFAQFRLKAYPIKSRNLGLAAHERGSLIHTALEKIWLEIKDQQTLWMYPDATLQLLINKALNYAIAKLISKKPPLVKSRLIELEKKHLSRLLLAWLEHEKQRPHFQVVATELKQQITIADIPLQIQIDRIDKLSDQSLLLIDYKTGHSDIQDWFGTRPNEPQLPLYCIASTQPIQGLAYAQIRYSAMKIKGIGNNSQALDNTIFRQLLDWDSQVKDWQATLENIAKQFRSGYAKRDPKDAPKTCRYCALPAFCRIYEQVSITF